MRRQPKYWDSLGREILLVRPPRTVVSLVPSDTYSLVKLGLADRIVGRTRYCVEPAAAVRGIAEMGGTKNPDVDEIVKARPDLVLANQEENTKRDLERIAQAGIAVYVSFPKRVAEGLAHLSRLAAMFDVGGDPEVRDMLRAHYEAVREAEQWRARATPRRAFFPIWMSPLMTIHRDTFISDAMDLAGAVNVFADRPRLYPLAADLGDAPALSPEEVAGRDTRYPRVTWDELVERAPELVLLPDEPHDFTEADADRFRALDVPAAKVRPRAGGEGAAIARVSGKDFCWHGARSLEGLERTRRVVASSA